MAGVRGVVGGKWKQLYLNNNKKDKNMENMNKMAINIFKKRKRKKEQPGGVKGTRRGMTPALGQPEDSLDVGFTF